MGYSVDPIADGCYDGTSVLVNKFDIRDGEKLAEVEAVVSSMRNAEWLNAPQTDTFDFEHYKAVHRYLFSDLYEWAGMIRTVNLSKKTTVFCPAAEIERRTALIFARVKPGTYSNHFLMMNLSRK